MFVVVLLIGPRPHTHLVAAAVGLPGIHQLLTNYRTHQGILDAAALVVDLIKVTVGNPIAHDDTSKCVTATCTAACNRTIMHCNKYVTATCTASKYGNSC